MATRKQARLAELDRYVSEWGIARVGEEEFASLLVLLAPIKDVGLRKLLGESGHLLEPVVEGVRQDNFDELERTLNALSDEYLQSARRGRAKQIRRLVITAKDHAKFASRSAKDEGRRAMKRQMVEWMLVWLENPGVFPQWARLRRRAAASDM